MTDYYSIPTTLGADKIAAAANVNEELTITHMAFGDANGLPYLPLARVNSTTLLNERHRVAIEYLNVDSANANVYITKARIPAAIGGFEINEIGLFDSDGDLIYLANYPRTFKPQITQGAGGELNVKIHITTSHSSALAIILDPNVITLTQANGDNRYALKTELDTEAATRANADMALSIALSQEITNRENADNSEAFNRQQQDINLAIAFNFISTALGQAQNTITQLSDYSSIGPDIWGNGYYKFPAAIGGIKFQFGRRVSGAPNAGSIVFPEAFSTTTLYIGITPIYNQNITDANAAVTHIKTYNLLGFTYSSGIEAESDDVFHGADVDFLWFALGF